MEWAFPICCSWVRLRCNSGCSQVPLPFSLDVCNAEAPAQNVLCLSSERFFLMTDLRLLEHLNAPGKSTARGSGLYHMGTSGWVFQGKSPWLYALIKEAGRTLPVWPPIRICLLDLGWVGFRSDPMRCQMGIDLERKVVALVVREIRSRRSCWLSGIVRIPLGCCMPGASASDL